jgi:hypothetical protein
MGCGGKRCPQPLQRRVTIGSRRDRGNNMGHAVRECIESIKADAFVALRPDSRNPVLRAAGAGDAPRCAIELPGERLGGKSKSEKENVVHASHSARTSSSLSSARWIVRCASWSVTSASMPWAHTAMARTSGDASRKCPWTTGRRAGSAVASSNQAVADEAVAPDALDRRTGKQGAEAASSSVRSVPRDGDMRSSRALSFASAQALANLFHGQTARQSSQP